MKPLCYLDVDDTLLRFPPFADKEFWLKNPRGAAADGAGEFFQWLMEHFEVRWLTMWCPGGQMSPHRAEELAGLLGVTADEIMAVNNPKAFYYHKTEALDLVSWVKDKRPWVWIEDEILPEEKTFLKNNVIYWIPCNVSLEPNRLNEVKEILKEQFGL